MLPVMVKAPGSVILKEEASGFDWVGVCESKSAEEANQTVDAETFIMGSGHGQALK
jgi:hypothetical protein